MTLVRVVLSLCVITALSACGKKGGVKGSSGPSPRQLVEQDLRDFKNINSDTLYRYDMLEGGLFSRIYGGTTPVALDRYLGERIRYFYTEAELRLMPSSPREFRYKGWMSATEVEVGAANIGMALWLAGLVDGVPVWVNDGREVINIDSSRAGLMMIGPGYKSSFNVGGRSYAIPAAYRQSILLHEARHSDCTGGITENDLNVLRTSNSMRETDIRFAAKACGHLHTFCPLGHEYSGVLACDDHAWGAYAVQYVFLRAVADDYSGLDKDIINARMADTLTRLQFKAGLTPTDMFQGRMGEPDMSSGGLH